MEQIKRDVIKKHLEGWNGELKNESIKNFAQSGKTSGSFFMALKEMLDDYVEQAKIRQNLRHVMKKIKNIFFLL
jgi:hypothetical protein